MTVRCKLLLHKACRLLCWVVRLRAVVLVRCTSNECSLLPTINSLATVSWLRQLLLGVLALG